MKEIQGIMSDAMIIKRGDEIQGSWTRYWGKEWRRVHDGFEVRVPPRYIDKVLAIAKLEHAKGAPTPAVVARRPEEPEEPLP
eukprot:5630946-Heterocapsa_arctica.AAC.1